MELAGGRLDVVVKTDAAPRPGEAHVSNASCAFWLARVEKNEKVYLGTLKQDLGVVDSPKATSRYQAHQLFRQRGVKQHLDLLPHGCCRKPKSYRGPQRIPIGVGVGSDPKGPRLFNLRCDFFEDDACGASRKGVSSVLEAIDWG